MHDDVRPGCCTVFRSSLRTYVRVSHRITNNAAGLQRLYLLLDFHLLLLLLLLLRHPSRQLSPLALSTSLAEWVQGPGFRVRAG
eukprot:2883187-Rhodomonas_salina.3